MTVVLETMITASLLLSFEPTNLLSNFCIEELGPVFCFKHEFQHQPQKIGFFIKSLNLVSPFFSLKLQI